MMSLKTTEFDMNRCLGRVGATTFHSVHAPNWGFNADANIGHAFGILMAYVGTLRTSCSGAG